MDQGANRGTNREANGGDNSGVDVDIIDLSYSVSVSGRQKHLLKNIYFHIDGGDMVALMGPSGAGKSTLLDLIAGRKRSGLWSGSILVNQQRRSCFFHRDSAYVLQDDLHIPTLTVKETIEYAAWAKLPEGTCVEDRCKRVQFLLHMMGLEHVQNSIVGDALSKGISGGQLKRLSIAVEIVALPSLIFLDEPTSGLDSAIALEVMGSVRGLADQNRTCVSTIHQPSPEVFGLFDKVVLLSEGRLVYAGTTENAITHLTSHEVGYCYNPDQNPAEFIIDVCGGLVTPSGNGISRAYTALELADLYKRSPYVSLVPDAADADNGVTVVDKSFSLYGNDRTHATTKLTQFEMLLHRSWKSQWRNVSDLKTAITKSVAVGALIGVVFYDKANVSKPYFTIDSDSGQALLTPEVQNLNSSFFFVLMYCLMCNLEQIPSICSSNTIYRRELASYTYSVLPYWLANCLSPLPLLIFTHTIWICMTYFLCVFPLNGDYFLYFYFITFLATLSSFYFAQCLAAVTNNAEVAFAIYPMTFIFLTQFTGYSIPVGSIPEGWKWASYISFPRWVFEGLMVNEYGDSGDQGEYVLEQYDFDNYNKNQTVWIMLLCIGLFSIATYAFLRPPRSKLQYGNMKSQDTAATVNATGLSEKLLSQDCTDAEIGSLILDTTEQPLLMHQDSNSSDANKPSSTGPLSNGCRLIFRNVVYSVRHKQTNENICVLKGVSGCANPGEMCTLMGASGAGKSTLLDLLANRKTTGVTSGDILFNGMERSSVIDQCSAYVMQDSVHLPMLTVRQTLTYAALLRMREGRSAKRKRARVQEIMDMLGLSSHADTIVGNARVRGISGGQAKRLSIGVEIINLPDIIFLDEPTTGLDSSIALEVMSAVRILASQNRTIIATIHQPSPPTYALFDKLLLLAEGRVIYYGSSRDAVSYFTSCPYEFRYVRGTNPADFIVSVAGSFTKSQDGLEVTATDLAACYCQHPSYTSLMCELNTMISSDREKALHDPAVVNSTSSSHYHTSTLFQIGVLCERGALNKWKAPQATMADFISHAFISLFYGSLYYNLDNDQYQERLSLLFFSLIFAIMGHQKSMPAIFEERLMFYRERGAGAYGPVAYWFSAGILALPLVTINIFVYSIIVYNLAGFTGPFSHFIIFFVTLLLSSVAGLFCCRMIAVLSATEQSAINLFPVCIYFLMAFAGFGIYLPEMQDWLSAWAPYVSFVRWGFQTLTLNEFSGNSDLALSGVYIDDLGFDKYSRGTCLSILPLFTAFFAVALLAALKFVNYEER